MLIDIGCRKVSNPIAEMAVRVILGHGKSHCSIDHIYTISDGG